MQKILCRLACMTNDSTAAEFSSAGPKDRRELDALDRRILELLQADARMPNNAIAAAVGIAPSTCHGRIRTLQENGVIRGFHADVDPAATGRGLQAMIAIRLHAHARSNLATFKDYLAQLPGVESIFFVTGDRDFLIHVALSDSEALRDLVAHNISVHSEVAGTNTSVIFEYVSVRQPAG
ncbi:Lrp/AsnC family transcriptional regulator [Arthrobacter sp. Helios]|uniref:Lrp/AsnC family transcriptional regulator n=1 Tax=Arthrobacter sp. Helios TaxID=2828862 RepID=UPI002062782B|nr:Lrp/AsnC family transcriptional regulator [Arthrobacter sp. Helios]UPO77305.1 Lrp/AsnC family transcriptional regulator [Arthrobacter sp. Helios]